MQSTPNPEQLDDPHDVLSVAPGVAPVAPTNEELSKLARTFRHPSDPQILTASDLSAGPSAPPVDTTFRPAVSEVQVLGRRRSIGRRAARAVTAALLLAACTGVAAIGWQSYGDAAEQMIALWVPQHVLASFLPLHKLALPAQSTQAPAEVAAADASPPQPASVTAPEGVTAPVAAPSVDSAKSLQPMADDIASVRQEIEQLKASIEELKASQQQMSRDIAKASEQSLRPKMSVPPPRSAAARVRRPMPPLSPPHAAAAPMLPQAAAPYAPPQPDAQPQATAQPQADPELASVPRPPMPVR
jgi:hypothetical protein